jgi:sugar lactone lactonase YvrE
MRSASIVIAPLAIGLLGACGGDRDRAPIEMTDPDAGMAPIDAGPTGIALLGGGTHSVDGLDLGEVGAGLGAMWEPRDIAFNPEEPSQLWVMNHGDNATIIFFDPGTPAEDWNKRSGFGNDHFLASPSAMAFGAPGTFASVQEEDEETQPSTPNDFMGPTLWTSDIGIYDSGHASHLDMLHNSPNAVGIAWDHDNLYWVFDGYHQSITRYDFQGDHGLGGEDHTDGIIARYVEGQVGYVPGVSSHMALDHATGLLYVADTGNGRVAVLDTASGTRAGSIGPNYDGAEMYAMEGATLTTLVDGAAVGMPRPSGLELHDGLLWVTDNELSKVLAFELDGTLVDWLDTSSVVPPGNLGAMAFGPDGALYVVDTPTHRIHRLSIPDAS